METWIFNTSMGTEEITIIIISLSVNKRREVTISMQMGGQYTEENTLFDCKEGLNFFCFDVSNIF